MVRAGVVFNTDDPDQALMWKHAKKRTNFSGYIKRLIQRDIDTGGVVVFAASPEGGILEEDFDLMEKFF